MLGGVVRGRRAMLRVPVPEDLPAVNRWMADLRVRDLGRIWAEPAWPATWKERLAEASKEEQAILWTVEQEGQAVGTVKVGLEPGTLSSSIEHFIVDPERWRQGIGWDVALALHRYLFDYLETRTTSVEMPADNAAGLRIAEKLGYAEFGRGHHVYYRAGKYADSVWLRFDQATWTERWSGEREYAPLPEGIEL